MEFGCVTKIHPDQCFESEKTQRQRGTAEFTHSLLVVSGKAADDLHRRRKDSDEEDASSPELTKFW